MLNLNNPKISYILTSGNIPAISSFLYSRDYSLIEINSYLEREQKLNLLAICIKNEDGLHKDIIKILENFSESVIYKDINEIHPRQINKKMYENVLDVELYNTDFNIENYIFDGISFSFKNQKKYKYNITKNELKNGMVVEYQSKNEWVKRKIVNLEYEFNNMYGLLIKHSKLRILS